MALGGSILTWFEGRWHAGNAPIIGAAIAGASYALITGAKPNAVDVGVTNNPGVGTAKKGR